jgi:2-dehydropantoate 2-reductase
LPYQPGRRQLNGYFGAKMAQAGFDVTFLARGAHLEAMKKNGLQVNSFMGDFKVKNINATDKISEINKSDLVILTVKAWQVKDLLNGLSGIMNPQGTILPLQNGVITADELKEKIPSEHVIGGLCRIISKIEAPGIISHVGVDPTIVFGELDNRKTDRMERIQAVFDKAGIKSRIAEDIQSELWKKFISICVSGLLAISRSTYGEIRELKETRNMMINLLTEIFNLSQKIGIHIEPDFVSKTVSFIDTFPYSATSSLTRDVWEGKPSEIEYQNGTVVKLADKFGVDVPINKFVYNCILPMERRARKE